MFEAITFLSSTVPHRPEIFQMGEASPTPCAVILKAIKWDRRTDGPRHDSPYRSTMPAVAPPFE